ncbi:MAG TPA: family 1 glycosylhydrolase [Acidimicrobiales bacterium]|jgi:beta-glucosidase|nr:family 1 glycosylhydrolase [Acidimicrobiales bacterium]
MPAFPDGFLWGTATAAHQVEGGNWNNDWWAWEHNPQSPCVEPSGDACDHYHRYRDDIRLLARLGFNTYRFSLEWSRIEPEEGEWSQAAVDHYRRVCEACRGAGITPMVTFHHFTTPRWAAHLGGWEEPDTAARFAAFCERVAAGLADLLGWACTINEPNMVALHGYRTGAFPPGRRDPALRRSVNDVLADAHRQAASAIRAVTRDVPVGMTLAMQETVPVEGGEAKAASLLRDTEDVFLDACHDDDFLGVQTYTRVRVGPDGLLPPPAEAEKTVMGYEFRPQALEATVRRAWSYLGGAVPLVVTENGIAATDDTRRIAYVEEALAGVQRCLADGVDLRGYVYWSALDNFEWAYGYAPAFGLIAVDRAAPGFPRTPKPSAEWLGRIAQANATGLEDRVAP